MPGGAAARPVERVRTSSSGAGRRDSVSFSGSTDTDVYPQTTTYHIHNITPASHSCCPLRNYLTDARNIIHMSEELKPWRGSEGFLLLLRFIGY